MCCFIHWFPYSCIKIVIIGFSLGMIVTSAFGLYYAVVARTSIVWLAYSNYLPYDLSLISFLVALFLSLLLIFLAVLGVVLVTKMKHCIVHCPYGALIFSAFLSFYIMGVLILAAGFYGAQAFEDYCLKSDFSYWEEFKLHTFVTTLETTYFEIDN